MRRHKTAQHAKIWKQLENSIFFYRSTAAMVLLLLTDCYDMFVWRTTFNEPTVCASSQETVVDKGESCVSEDTERILNYVRRAYRAAALARVILLLISIKKPKICKLYLFYELALHLASQSELSLVHADNYLAGKISLMATVILFNALYYNVWLSMAAILLCQLAMQFADKILDANSDDDDVEPIAGFVLNSLWLMVVLPLCHMLVTYFGNKYIEVEMKSLDKDQLLDGLEEGLVIVDHDQKLLYENHQAARKFVAPVKAAAGPSLDVVPSAIGFASKHKFVKCEAVFKWDQTADF